VVFICSVAFKTVYVGDLLAEVNIETTLIVERTRLYDPAPEIFQICSYVYKRKCTLDCRSFYVQVTKTIKEILSIFYSVFLYVLCNSFSRYSEHGR
jgi:hypothetical protein